MSTRLTDGFRNIVDLRWRDFVEIEKSRDGTNFDSAITGLVRACKKGNLRAIQMALDRLDGKIATELEVEMPKFYYLYPYATKVADDLNVIDADENGVVQVSTEGVAKTGIDPETPNLVGVEGAPADIDEQAAAEEELPSGQLRPVLDKMLDSPKSIVTDILASADLVDKGHYTAGNPMVKSVMVAGMMKLVQDGKMSAVFEVFEQIDGKVAEKLKMLGNDVYVTKFDQIAPAGAVKNEKGVYQLEATTTTTVWVDRLEQGRKSR